MVVGGMLGYVGGAGLAAKLLPFIGGDQSVGAQMGAGFASVMVIGPLLALVGAAVGYQRGKRADYGRWRPDE